METGSQLDLISELPQDVIQTILVKLPIIDAVRTSILSSRWRYEWASISDIVIDDNVADRDIYWIVNFISKLLFLHDGPIRKFSLSTLKFQPTESDICQWLLFLSRKDVKELVIDTRQLMRGKYFKVPSCLFSFKNLTRLDLFKCELNPPPNFEGFPFLKSFFLSEVLVSQDKLESLISSSHLLDDLTILDIDMIDIDDIYLTVCVPNLKHLRLDGCFMELSVANTPHLVDLTLALDMKTRSNLEKHLKNTKFCYYERIWGGVPNLERLEFHAYSIVCISLQIDSLQWKRIVFCHLKCLELDDVDFYQAKEVLVVVRIINTCPNLQNLQISGYLGRENELQRQQKKEENKPQNLSFGDSIELLKLKTVKFSCVFGAAYEMKFIEYLLQRSPALEQMRISPSPYISTDISLEIETELVALRRAAGLYNSICRFWVMKPSKTCS